jgi:tRNA threonylcarbamoyladenosine biosynthesis protein TsaE
MKKYSVANESELLELAEEFTKTLEGGDVIGLIGPLGAGKTTFVRGIVRALGGTQKVKSPTFTVMNEYSLPHPEIAKVVHMDWYRFQDPVELEALALEDVDPSSLTFIEWPDVFEERAFPLRREVRIDFDGEGRVVEF